MASALISDIYAGKLRVLVELISRALDSDAPDYANFEEKDVNGCSLLETLTVLGEWQLIEKLVTKNKDIFEPNLYGYDIVHLAAIWDNEKLIKAMYFCGIDLKGYTALGEDAITLAKRYHSENAIKMFAWIELRESFLALIQQARNILKSADKMGIKLTKEERVIILFSVSLLFLAVSRGSVY
uniref:Ankyrin repeat domain-containing protein 45 n=1 Tax=Schistocephalus solidus TaxID=70667 RepID=A0A0V0J834_SCHSO